MSGLVIVLMLVAPLVLIALRVRAARCRLCKTAAASRLVGMLLLWAASPLVSEVGAPWPVQFVLGLLVAAVVLKPLPRWMSRWLHTGPPCAAVGSSGDVQASRHQHNPPHPTADTTGPHAPRPAITPHHRNEQP